MHINARDRPPSKAFCFIIEYTPYFKILEFGRNVIKIHFRRSAKMSENGPKKCKNVRKFSGIKMPSYFKKMIL